MERKGHRANKIAAIRMAFVGKFHLWCIILQPSAARSVARPGTGIAVDREIL